VIAAEGAGVELPPFQTLTVEVVSAEDGDGFAVYLFETDRAEEFVRLLLRFRGGETWLYAVFTHENAFWRQFLDLTISAEFAENLEFVVLAVFHKFAEADGDIFHFSEDHAFHFDFIVLPREEIVEEDRRDFAYIGQLILFLKSRSMP
jgi:hypothetical protein